jgi:hypothetical protein
MTMISEARVPSIGKLAKLRDASIASPTDRQGLVWNNTLGKWQNSTLTQTDISGLTASLAAKANLSGGNSFSGNQFMEGGTAGLNVLRLKNTNSGGYVATAAADYLNHEVMAWGYGNPSGTPSDCGYLEMSRAGLGSGTAPAWRRLMTGDFGNPGATPFGQYTKELWDTDGSHYIFPSGYALVDPTTYASFRHLASGGRTRFGPNSGAYFDFNHDGFTPALSVLGGNAFDILFASQRFRAYAGKWAFGGDSSYIPAAIIDVRGDLLVSGPGDDPTTGTHIVATFGDARTGFGGSNDANAEFFVQQKGISYQVNGQGIVTLPGVMWGMRKRGTWNKADDNTNGVNADFVVRTSTGGSQTSAPTIADRLLISHEGLFIPNVVSAPPTKAGGGTLYVTGGALRYKGSSGSDNLVAAA